LTGIVLQGLVVGVATGLFAWHYIAAQLAATAVALCTTFLMNRQWTF
jgi:putative flippase GtrA